MNEHLYRSRDDRMLAGVAGGLAEIWDADPSLIRIVWALLVVLTGGIALLVYIVMAIVVPEEDEFHPARRRCPDARPRHRLPPTPAAEPGRPGAVGRMPGPPRPRRSPRRCPPHRSPAGASRPPIQRARSQQARAARRAARRERGDNRTAGIVIGAILILIGVVFFLREWLPAFDFDLVLAADPRRPRRRPARRSASRVTPASGGTSA